MRVPLYSKPPYVWPEPRECAGIPDIELQQPLESLAAQSHSLFGVISAPNREAIEWINRFLSRNEKTQTRLVISLYPACRTSREDLDELLYLIYRFDERVDFRLYPEHNLLDRSANLLIFCAEDGTHYFSTGPSENLGFTSRSPASGNVVSKASPVTLEACRNWFDYLWSVSGPLDGDIASIMPELVLPKGSLEAAERWADYRRRCLSGELTMELDMQASVDPETGVVELKCAGDTETLSPTGDLGIPTLDPLGTRIADLYDSGSLVAIDKTTRIPPLASPIAPEWFGMESFRQSGSFTARTSLKVVDLHLKLTQDLHLKLTHPGRQIMA